MAAVKLSPAPGSDVLPTVAPGTLRVGLEVADTTAEGPGRRYAVWVQGCPFRCPGCCNPELLAFVGRDGKALGLEVRVEDLVGRILATPGIEGVTFVGGEPFAQATGLSEVARSVRRAGLSVMVFSGFTLEELRASSEPAVADLLAATDLLVDGRFDRDRPDTDRRWIGSTNQRVHAWSPRARADDPRFRESDELEIRWLRGALVVNGRPIPRAALPGVRRSGGRALPEVEEA